MNNRFNQQSGTIRGIIFLLTAVLLFAIQDVIIKGMSSSYALLEIVVIRSCFSMVIVLGILYFQESWSALRSKNWKLQFWRGMWMFSAYLFFFMGLAALPFSTVTALFFSNPLFMTALSVLILGEKVGWPRWLAILVGFVGVIVIIQPTSDSFDFASLFILIAAVAYAMSMITTRKIKDSGTSIAVYTTVIYLTSAIILSPLFASLDLGTHPSFAFLTKAWTIPLAWDIFLIFVTSLCWGSGMVLLSAAYRDTAVSTLAPFEYFAVFFGILLGFLIWGERLTIEMILGVALIVSSGLFILYRENQIPEES